METPAICAASTSEIVSKLEERKEISTSPTHPLVPTVIQPDGTVIENNRRLSIIYPRPSSSRSHRNREHRGSTETFRRSHEIINVVNLSCENDYVHDLSLRPQFLDSIGHSPHRRLTLADALIPRNSSRESECSTPRRHSDNSDAVPELTLEALLIAGSRRNSLRVNDDHMSRRSSRSSRASSSRRRSSSSKRHRKISSASALSGIDRYSYQEGSTVPSHASCCEEVEDEEVVRKRARIARVIGSVAAAIFLGAILLVALTLSMTPTIDEMGEYISVSPQIHSKIITTLPRECGKLTRYSLI